MQKELFFERIRNLSDLRDGDRVLHLYKSKTSFSEMLLNSVGKTGKIFAININALASKTPRDNIEFYTKKDNLNLKPETLDLIFIERTLFNLEDLGETLSGIKKYLTKKGKIIVYRKTGLLSFLQNKTIHEFMFLAGFKLKNKFNLKNSTLEIYETE